MCHHATHNFLPLLCIQASTLSFLSVQQLFNTFCLHFLALPPPPVVAWVRGSMVEAGVGVGGWILLVQR